ncbi:hypothetical protein ABVK25_004727 [Lepraria finkii]|uniref:Uncharacterized protein n=1 Tax=Lepraria finkii TaxID=1340010 RepID=A0ABR4BAR4_9LECA
MSQANATVIYGDGNEGNEALPSPFADSETESSSRNLTPSSDSNVGQVDSERAQQQKPLKGIAPDTSSKRRLSFFSFYRRVRPNNVDGRMLKSCFPVAWPLMNLLTVFLGTTETRRDRPMVVSEMTSRMVYMEADVTGVLYPQDYRIYKTMSTENELFPTRLYGHRYLAVQPLDMFASPWPPFHPHPYTSLRPQSQALPIDTRATR